MGHSDDGYPYHLEGVLDELRIYDRALSASEVCQLHHDPGFENQYEGTCANGIDDDCDTYTDSEDPGCQPPASCVGTAQASTYASNPTYCSSDLVKHVSFFLIPLAAVVAIRIWRMRRQEAHSPSALRRAVSFVGTAFFYLLLGYT